MAQTFLLGMSHSKPESFRNKSPKEVFGGSKEANNCKTLQMKIDSLRSTEEILVLTPEYALTVPSLFQAHIGRQGSYCSSRLEIDLYS